MLKNCAYKIIIVLVLATLLIVSTVNAYYFFRLKNGKSLGSFELNSMYWASVILSILLAIVFAWAIYQSVISCEIDKKVKKEYGYYKKGREIEEYD